MKTSIYSSFLPSLLLLFSGQIFAMPQVEVPIGNVNEEVICRGGYCPHGMQGLCFETEEVIQIPSGAVSAQQKEVIYVSSFEALATGDLEVEVKPEVHCTIEESLSSLFLINASCLPSLPDEEVQKRKEAFMNYCMYGQATKPEDPEKGAGFYGSCSSALPFIDPRIVHDKARAFCEAEYNLSHQWQCECYEQEQKCLKESCECSSDCYSKHKRDKAGYEDCKKKCDDDEKTCRTEKKGCDTKLCLKFRELKNRGIAECAKLAIPNIF